MQQKQHHSRLHTCVAPQSIWLLHTSHHTCFGAIKQVHNSFEEDGSHMHALCQGMKLVDEEYERVSALGEGTYGTVCVVI